MNNERINLINQIASKYNLNSEQVNILSQKFNEDKRDFATVNREIEITANYFGYQNYFNNIIINTPPLESSKTHYVQAFGSNSVPFLQPVTISITNPEVNEVMVENSFKGRQKHDNVDDIEIAICQIVSL